MRNRDTFSGYHPTINFLYFALVLLFSMCLMHPVYLLISLIGALAYDIYLKGRKAVRFAVMGLLPMAVLAALVNPAFNHEGATILTYLPSGNPLTLESMLYGSWSHGAWKMQSKRQIPCVPAATDCRGARRFPSIVLMIETKTFSRG